MAEVEQQQKENRALKEQIEILVNTQKIQKQRVGQYLTESYAETSSLREEVQNLTTQANNLLKELQLLKHQKK